MIALNDKISKNMLHIIFTTNNHLHIFEFPSHRRVRIFDVPVTYGYSADKNVSLMRHIHENVAYTIARSNRSLSVSLLSMRFDVRCYVTHVVSGPVITAITTVVTVCALHNSYNRFYDESRARSCDMLMQCAASE